MNKTPIASLMIDIQDTTLSADEIELLRSPYVAGIILFKRNIQNPTQVRTLTDSIRNINPQLIVATDQEGGRVMRLKGEFTPLPAMGELGKLYTQNPQYALSLAYQIGYVMACEVLAVGIDMSFAPVLDIDAGSLVIGDRAFHRDATIVSLLSEQFIKAMNDAGMKATGKHFPGHGSVIADSHLSDAHDGRSFEQILKTDLVAFNHNLHHLTALMPAHVVFSCVDDKPAGFSKIWLQDILRDQLGFDGAIFSDDLSMKAAHVAGGVLERTVCALQAGCDVALICNDPDGAKTVVDQAHLLPRLSKNRFAQMKATFPQWMGNLSATCLFFEHWQNAKAQILAAFTPKLKQNDPTNYQHN